jgi:hypothetical protein
LAESDNKIRLEIILDDGSVQKGFATIQKSGEETADSLTKSLSKAFKIDGLADLNAGLNIVKSAVDKVGEAFKKAFDLTLEGENLKKIDKQFEILAQNAGVSANALRDGLTQAAGGLVDNTDLIKAANGALVQLGVNAEKLPQLFEVARKTASVFGGTALERFQDISQAIATGQTRQIKSLGLVVDLDKAQKEYAKSLGSVNLKLTDQQEQFVRLNAVLDAAQKKYGAIQVSNESLSAQSQILKASFSDLGDTIALLFNKFFGGFFVSALQSVSENIKLFSLNLKNTFSPELLDSAEKVDLLQKRLDFLKQSKDFSPFGKETFGSPAQIAELTAQIDALKNKTTDQKNTLGAMTNAQNQSNAATQAAILLTTQQNQVLNDQLQTENKILGFRLQNFQATVALDQQRLTNANTQDEQLIALKQVTNDKLYQLDLQYRQQKNALDLAFDDSDYQQKQTQDALIIAQEKSFQQQRLAILEQSREQQSKILFDFTERWKLASAQISQTLRQGLVTAVSGSIQTMVTALQNGQRGLDAFGKFIASTIGELAIKVGETLIGSAIGMIALGQLNPFAALAAGVGLVAIGTILKNLGGAGATEGVVGGAAAQPQQGAAFTPTPIPEDQRTRTANTDVQVVIQGDVLDSDATGMRIVDLINQAFDKQGVTVRQGL